MSEVSQKSIKGFRRYREDTKFKGKSFDLDRDLDLKSIAGS